MKYRKKPIVIEAIQYNGNNKREIYHFVFGGVIISIIENRIKIPTLEGDMWVDIGDWIIKGIHGEFYPCKPDIFKKTYEIVKE